MRTVVLVGILAIPCGMVSAGEAVDMASLVQGRLAVERVYHEHRTGVKQPFEVAVPVAVVRSKVGLALKKEGLLRRVYGVEVSKGMVDREVARIDAKTRAPEMLEEIKGALDGDAASYAEVFVKPLVVERELRRHYHDDAARHAGERLKADEVREILLKAEVGERVKIMDGEGEMRGLVGEVVWELGERPEEKAESGELCLEDLPPEVGKLGPNAKNLTTGGEKNRKFYLEDVRKDLRRVIEVQLKKEGDVSAVIEAPQEFLLFLVTEKTEDVLGVKTLTVRKMDYGTWVNEAKEEAK